MSLNLHSTKLESTIACFSCLSRKTDWLGYLKPGGKFTFPFLPQGDTIIRGIASFLKGVNCISLLTNIWYLTLPPREGWLPHFPPPIGSLLTVTFCPSGYLWLSVLAWRTAPGKALSSTPLEVGRWTTWWRRNPSLKGCDSSRKSIKRSEGKYDEQQTNWRESLELKIQWWDNPVAWYRFLFWMLTSFKHQMNFYTMKESTKGQEENLRKKPSQCCSRKAWR